MNILYIDTRDRNLIIVSLDKSGKKFVQKSEANKNQAQAALPMIEKILRAANLKPKDISEINVETGPGSFTGLRVGIAIANALSFAADVKINGKEIGEIVLPEY